MTVYVLVSGKLVERPERSPCCQTRRSGFPAPMVSRFEAMESPVTGQTISSWRARDRDMDAVGAVDPRDIPKAAFEKRKKVTERNARSESA